MELRSQPVIIAWFTKHGCSTDITMWRRMCPLIIPGTFKVYYYNSFFFFQVLNPQMPNMSGLSGPMDYLEQVITSYHLLDGSQTNFR